MYKSRTLASDAIKGGKVKLNGENFKPSHVVKIGETYTISLAPGKKIIEVISLVEKRGSFEVAKQHYNDHTPQTQKEDKAPAAFFKVNVRRDKGTGRPTKKDRRDQEDFRSEGN
jgi:ribosome-associated heat shock protein Hsp15